MSEKFLPDPEAFGKAIGGRAVALLIAEEEADRELRWNQNAEFIGRILRAHLYVEHYLTSYLRAINSSLGDLDEARIGFAQKVVLLGTSDVAVSALIGGIRRLNQIRNRLAHHLTVTVTDEDAGVFMSLKPFADDWDGHEILNSEAGGKPLSRLPIDMLEGFAKLAGRTLQVAERKGGAGPRLALQQALKELGP
jgi:hypothetical protein